MDKILFNIQFHQSTKKELEEKMNKMEHSDEKLAKDISYHGKTVEIWSVNETKLRKQMRENQ